MTGSYFEAVSDAAVQVRGMYKSADEYKTITLTHLMGATPVESTLALEQNGDELTIRGQLLEPRSGKKPTSGGSSDTEVNEPTTMPAGLSSVPADVTTHTPVGY